MHNPSCKSCAFQTRAPAEQDLLSRMLLCRRNPPTVMLIPSPQGAQMMGVLPPVGADHWCGEWEPAESASMAELQAAALSEKEAPKNARR